MRTPKEQLLDVILAKLNAAEGPDIIFWANAMAAAGKLDDEGRMPAMASERVPYLRTDDTALSHTYPWWQSYYVAPHGSGSFVPSPLTAVGATKSPTIHPCACPEGSMVPGCHAPHWEERNGPSS